MSRSKPQTKKKMTPRKSYIPPEFRDNAAQNSLLTIREVSIRWQISPATIYRMISDGRLKPVKLGPGVTRFRSTDIAAVEAAS